MNAAVEEGRLVAEDSTISLLNRSEIEQQIATARRFPRSVKKFRDEALQMVTLSESIAEQCIYALPRDGKTIEGPSARFAEVIASAWGNCRAGARVVDDTGEFVTAQGVFHDLERNVAITYEVQRRITDKRGNRYKADMIGVTANAACSIALRNSILKGVPKAFWSDMYEQARATAIGDVQTLANRRARALNVLQKMGVAPEQVFAFLKIGGQEDITLEHLSTLFGITTALKEGDTTPEQAFAIDGQTATTTQPAAKTLDAMSPEHFAKNEAGWKRMVQAGQKTADDLVAMLSTRHALSDQQKAAIKAFEDFGGDSPIDGAPAGVEGGAQ